MVTMVENQENNLVDEKLHREIDRFLRDSMNFRHPGNEWLYGDYAELYVRKGGLRMFDKQRVRPFELATMTVQGAHRGKGLLRSLLAFVEAKNIPLYIENVMEERLCRFFEQRGYQESPDDLKFPIITPRTFFKFPETATHCTQDTGSAPI